MERSNIHDNGKDLFDNLLVKVNRTYAVLISLYLGLLAYELSKEFLDVVESLFKAIFLRKGINPKVKTGSMLLAEFQVGGGKFTTEQHTCVFSKLIHQILNESCKSS